MIEYGNADRNDKIKLEELCKKVLQLHIENQSDSFHDMKVDFDEIYQSDIFADKQYGIYKALDGDLIVGYLICKIRIVQGSKFVYLNEIGIESSYKSQGIGSRLFELAKEFGKRNEASTFELGVWEFNQDAIKFYESLGFRTKRRVMELEL